MHTPGPWWFCAAEEDYYVAGVGDKELTNLISRADARLIAAAPDLLNALMAVLPYINAPIGYAEQARAAIAKATKEI